jgi:lipopolysaccharide export LptBFGC system permease protein LptF
MERVIDPLITDLQVEYADAVRRGQPWKGRRVYISGWIAFFKVIAVCTWSGALSWHRWTKDDRRALIRSLTFSGVFIVAFTVLELLAVPMSVLRSSYSAASRLLLYLIPQALSITVTVGATFGILFGVGGRRFSGRVGAAVAALALVASAFSFVNMGWILPEANQSYRVASSGRPDPPKGPPELTLGELRREVMVVDRDPSGVPSWYSGNVPRYTRDLTFHYHERLGLSFSPLVLALFALSIAAGGSKRWVLGIAACVTFLGYYIVLYAGRSLALDGTLPAYVSAWSPNVAVALVAALLTLRKSRTRVGYVPTAR